VPLPSHTRAYIGLLVIVTLWASYPAAIKLALPDMPPLLMAALRCIIAAAFLVVLLLRSSVESVRAISPGALGAFLLLGFAGIFVSTQGSYLSIYYSTAANIILLQAATPVMTALGARLYLGERLLAPQWAGVAVSAFGVLVVVTRGRLIALRPEDVHVGDLINLVCLAGWTTYTVYSKRVLATYSPAMVTAGAYVAGTLMILPVAIVTAPLFPTPRWTSPVAWGVVLYQAVMGAIAHVWWARAIRAVGPSRSAMFLNVQPVIGLALAALVLGEHIGVWQLAGGACVLAGVAMTTHRAGRST
jgi:drug/metabolite transporter (DMT)-like permease